MKEQMYMWWRSEDGNKFEIKMSASPFDSYFTYSYGDVKLAEFLFYELFTGNIPYPKFNRGTLDDIVKEMEALK